MTLYLAGPMRGKPAFNKRAFDKATAALRAAGYGVISPVEMDEFAGWDLNTMTTLDLPPNWRREVLARDTEAVSLSDGVALLPDWSESEGAVVEIACARFLRIPVREVEAWLACTPIPQPAAQ